MLRMSTCLGGNCAHRIWVSVVALAFAETVSWGILFYSFGVLLPAMEVDLRLSRTTLTAIFSGALLVGGFAAAPVGRWLDRWGARRVMTLGSVAAALLVWTWSHVHSAAGFAAVWLAIGFTHSLVLYEPAFAAITAWFEDICRRSRALLVITLVAGFASTVFSRLPALCWRRMTGARRFAFSR